ncbi:uncharacterized protein KY384_001585 [Bacidia gigantensis]|uniref:uncharacterized protein n=1 Tax=Bacidia gigantensis TaxID=2732470 RepID=UPI001D043C84|nr:uncharacterized protein KY384_001585 [Bacidia gigantensis]KAG8533844.1 hypothetical protein KY384_001585 [Bacidia gigantensis]
MQVAPQQPQPPLSPSSYPLDPTPTSRRQYQQSPVSAEQPRSPSNTRGSPHSSRRPSRRPSGNNNNQQVSPDTRSASNTPRVPDVPSTHASNVAPLPATSSSRDSHRGPRDQRSQDAQQNAAPFQLPPRTSSNQRNPHTDSQSDTQLIDRTNTQLEGQRYDEQAFSSRRTHNEPSNTGRGRSDSEAIGTSNNVAAPIPASASQSRRRGPASPQGPQRAISTREPSSQQTPNTSQSRATINVVSTSSTSSRPTHNDGQVINRVVVDDPVVDLHRAHERELDSSSTKQARLLCSKCRKFFPQKRYIRFGEFMLGQTLGEGEFGKVKLGWKTDGSVEVAIKLIRRESLGNNPSRLPKIHREIKILETLKHPNIVKLHEMVETREYIGMVLEYASGGELFDYILNQRYLKDNVARKLFAQLVSGVGYLHKKGIVHRDLKLENLLLDRNRNIIITDFGFANTFDPRDELELRDEEKLSDRDYIKRKGLDRVHNGVRRGDLMATSCGSPCYAAPELVVTDSLYTGRKVDVWSCGVILYAMLAGYLPFDDDPENPDGDNINQLYKYITTTPLTFPEYVTPHARDLLRRILVANPRKRADLFEVARHSWLTDYAHVVAQVTSSTTTVGDIATATVTSATQDAPGLTRSHSVREPTKPVTSNVSPVGALSHQGKIDPNQPQEKTEPPRDSKRRTVQVEYVAPQRSTARGEAMPTSDKSRIDDSLATTTTAPSRSRVRAGTDGGEAGSRQYTSTQKPLPQDPNYRSEKAYHTQRDARRGCQPSGVSQRDMAPPDRPPKDYPRSVSDSTGAFGQISVSSGRPATGGSMTSTGQARLPSRGNSYSQPLAPTVAATYAQGRVTQPKPENKYNISGPMPLSEPFRTTQSDSRPSTQQHAAVTAPRDPPRTHKRANTLGNFFRTGSISGPKPIPHTPDETPPKEKRYPPTSMKAPIPVETPPGNLPSRDVRRLASIERVGRTATFQGRTSRAGFPCCRLHSPSEALQALGAAEMELQSSDQLRSADKLTSKTMNYQKGASDFDFRQDTDAGVNLDGQRDTRRGSAAAPPRRRNPTPRTPATAPQSQYGPTRYQDHYPPPKVLQQSQPYLGSPSESRTSIQNQQFRPVYPPGFGSEEQEPQPRKSMQQARPTRGPAVLTKSNRRFADAYEQDPEPGSGSGHHAGTTGAAKRVMDFFRRRGRARAGEEKT